MTTLGCAGLRAHELCDLNVDDVDLIHDRLDIRDARPRPACATST
jgi:integrase